MGDLGALSLSKGSVAGSFMATNTWGPWTGIDKKQLSSTNT